MASPTALQHFTVTLYPRIAVAVLTLLAGVAGAAAAEDAIADADAADPTTLTDALIIEPVGRYGRAPIHIDAIEHRMIEGSWKTPTAGDVITASDGEHRTWRSAHTNEEGWLNETALRGGYACWIVTQPRDRIMILHAQGHIAVCVNGAWRAGDPYQTGWTQLPVVLHEGENELLFHVGRGALRAEMRQPKSSVEFNTSEATLPTLMTGESADTRGAAVLINATNTWMRGLKIRAACGALGTDETRSVPAIPPMTIRKVAFDIACEAPRKPGAHELTLSVANDSGQQLDTATVPLRVVTTDDVIVRTFISEIDGSVQYYALRLAKDDEAANAFDNARKGLILSLHGASVEAAHQASCYTPKSWAHLVAPTNRRPYGFDWEDWGRLDAIEVLDLALAQLNADPDRVAVTGHSMGGHGAWHLAVNFPEKFVAVAPSAGWVSFWSYTGASLFDASNPIEAMLARATQPSQTLDHVNNLSSLGVYILHGDKDDNVPVEQARIMREALGKFHTDFAYHEEPGAGHWWGNQCMDYLPLMAFLETRLRDARNVGDKPDDAPEKESQRTGPFKDAFRNNFLFVVGTSGSPDENAAAMNKARYDAETFWYRGNGSIDIVPDTEFDPVAETDRSVILYGNADTNRAWNTLLADSPIQVRRGAIEVGDKRIEADNLACIMIRPRPGPANSMASVGVIAGTSINGLQLTMRLPVFVSGVAYPDLMIWSTDALEKGTDAILCTGFFGNDFSLEHGDFAWKSE
jgi:pimeloyl-ACP methyl ester carboxylesterase